jgi:uncharacterized protein
LPTHVVQVNKDQEVLQVLQEEVSQLDVSSAVVTLIGAVKEAEVSVMAKDSESTSLWQARTSQRPVIFIAP